MTQNTPGHRCSSWLNNGSGYSSDRSVSKTGTDIPHVEMPISNEVFQLMSSITISAQGSQQENLRSIRFLQLVFSRLTLFDELQRHRHSYERIHTQPKHPSGT